LVTDIRLTLMKSRLIPNAPKPVPGLMQRCRKITGDFLKRQWREYRAFILFFAFVVIPVKSTLADINWVPTGSMNPTIVEGDMVFVNKLAYDLRLPLTLHSLDHRADPTRGDITVLFSPQDGTRLVKRVIGTPGDEIQLVNNVLFINGKRASYSRLSADESSDVQEQLRRVAVFAEEDLGDHVHSVMAIPSIHSDKRSFGPITIPEDCYFVMGDNRDNSLDSRSYGVVDRKQFVGKATGVVVSFNILDKFQPRLGRFFSSLD
jgi:signal peptidase I